MIWQRLESFICFCTLSCIVYVRKRVDFVDGNNSKANCQLKSGILLSLYASDCNHASQYRCVLLLQTISEPLQNHICHLPPKSKVTQAQQKVIVQKEHSSVVMMINMSVSGPEAFSSLCFSWIWAKIYVWLTGMLVGMSFFLFVLGYGSMNEWMKTSVFCCCCFHFHLQGIYTEKGKNQD